MKHRYLIVALLIAPSAGLMGSGAPQKAPGTLQKTLKLKEKHLESSRKKDVSELSLVNLFMFFSTVGGRYILDKLTHTPHDFRHNIASSALISTLLAQIVYPAFETISKSMTGKMMLWRTTSGSHFLQRIYELLSVN